VIVRVLTARVSSPNVGQFNHKLRAQLDELREQKGLVYAKLARRLTEDGGEEVVLFEEWRTPAHLWEWTGGRLNRPRLLPGTEDLIDDLTITHYEALDITPEDLKLSVIEGAVSDGAGEEPPAQPVDQPPESTAEADRSGQAS
jgi:heme-degrading monooxygenase HmoA